MPISPSSAIRMVTPGSGRPTVPIRMCAFRLTATAGRSRSGRIPRRRSRRCRGRSAPSRAPSGAPPEIASLHAPAERRPELAVDQPVEERVLGRSRARVRPGSSASLYAIATARPRSKIAPFPSACARLPCGVVDLLEHPRHGEHERRPERLQVGGEVRVSAVWAGRTRAAHRRRSGSPGEACASGRNSSVEPCVDRCPAPGTRLPTSASRLRWVSMQPLGRPVVPLV